MDISFRELLRKFCMETSILGLKYFYIYPDIISRCFWAVTMIVITWFSLLLTWLLYNRFTEIPTRITIENQNEPLLGTPFPAITICSPNQITISSMRHFNRTLVDGSLTLDLEKVLPGLLGFYNALSLDDFGALEHLQTLIDLNRYTIPEVMFALPQRCEDFLVMCILAGRVYPRCLGLLRPVLTSHGVCCSFNSVYHFRNGRRNEKDPNFVVRRVQAPLDPEVLTVVTDYNPEDALDHTILNAGSTRVMMNDATEFPSDDEMKLLPPNSQTVHIIQATYTYCSVEVEQLPYWSRNCYFKNEYRLRFFGEFHNSDCDLLCTVKAVEKGCQCQMVYVPYVHGSRACNLTNIACILMVKLHLHKYVSPAECDCPRDCDHLQYRMSTSVGTLGGLPYVLNRPYANLKYNKSSSLMHFFFNNPSYVKQKQETVMSVINLISNLGGVFGLCIGCSTISVLEIMFFIYIAIRNHFRRRFQRRVYPVIN